MANYFSNRNNNLSKKAALHAELRNIYEQEQAELTEKINTLTKEIADQADQATNVERFISQVKKHLTLETLTPTVVNDMIQAIYVHAPDTSNGKRV